LVAIAGVSGSSARAEAGDYRAGTHCDVISPAVRTRDAARIGVVEFFAYSCGGCYSFEPLVKKWRRGLAADVDFRPSPAVWAAPMELHARAYFAAAALGVLDKVHGAIFAAMHVDRKRLSGEAEIRRVFVDNGVSGEDFDRAFRSFGVGSQARQAGALARSARIAFRCVAPPCASKWRKNGLAFPIVSLRTPESDRLLAREAPAQGTVWRLAGACRLARNAGYSASHSGIGRFRACRKEGLNSLLW